MTTSKNRIVFPIYPGMTPLDFAGPYQLLKRLPDSEMIVASLSGGVVSADGLEFAGTRPLSEINRCEVICVPGGPGATGIALDAAFMAEIRRLAMTAKYITSVCTGSLILGAVGLLKGKRAACHWSMRDSLSQFGALPDEARVVRDGNVITGGGVTSGIDFALTLIAELAGDSVAQMIQLGVEYAPAPSFNAGRPETAPKAILERYLAMTAGSAPKRLEEVRRAAAQMPA